MSKKLPSHPNLENLKKQAKQLAKGHKDGQVEAFARIKTHYPKLADASVGEILVADFSLCNAQLVVAREYGFATWQTLGEAVAAPQASGVVDALLGPNPGLRWIEEQVALLASVEIPVLICGEPGTGKALAAGQGRAWAGRHALFGRGQNAVLRSAGQALCAAQRGHLPTRRRR